MHGKIVQLLNIFHHKQILNFLLTKINTKMKKLNLLLIAFLMVPVLFLTSCKEESTGDDDNNTETKAASVILKEYLVAEEMDISNIITTTDGKKFVVAAPTNEDKTPVTDAEAEAWADGYYIMDIRNATDFSGSEAGQGHIAGAENVAFADILTKAEAATKPILVVCYSGQTACFATALLRLAGYDAQALKWGMSGWNSEFDKWTGKIGDIADGNSNWSYDAAPATSVYDAPSISSTSTDGHTILMEQVQNVITEGFGANSVSGADVLDNPTGYFINNYFGDGDYIGFGHVKGAYRINPLTLENTNTLDPEGKVVTYCYTGQTSAVITAYLNVLGYDAYSLTYGMNGLYNTNSQWASNQWGKDSKSKDYPTVD
jgi:rhodanese-related sulfurtransferase